jgi:hypothetical protein
METFTCKKCVRFYIGFEGLSIIVDQLHNLQEQTQKDRQCTYKRNIGVRLLNYC